MKQFLISRHLERILMNIYSYGNDDSFSQLHKSLNQPVLYWGKAGKTVKDHNAVFYDCRPFHRSCQKLQCLLCGDKAIPDVSLKAMVKRLKVLKLVVQGTSSLGIICQFTDLIRGNSILHKLREG